jgi:carbon-monoxide dehydrogenase small subunit
MASLQTLHVEVNGQAQVRSVAPRQHLVDFIRNALGLKGSHLGCEHSADGDVRDLQDAFVRNNALQCGFCTPGMVMAAKELLEAKPDATREEVREWMSGNYCRCTGYHAIVDAICETLAERAKNASSRPSEKVSA